jgi:hypothetical protein
MIMNTGRYDNPSKGQSLMPSKVFSRVFSDEPQCIINTRELQDMAICFDVSDNEEQIVISLSQEDSMVIVNDHQCHYLLLLLARQRMIDQAMGFADQDLGWIELEQFTLMLRKNQQMLYPQLMLFTDSTNQILCDAQSKPHEVELPPLVEVSKNRIRFTYDNIQINCSQWCD